ncbi:glucose-6-phosphate dehydrogenase [Spirochaetia bacterium 38H-sp]|uniref:Glucose-6-phosphate 1-dehydrogenase n=1 Tax=Rarispira pelagica TaxID=3141764 RepID=A0ABU9U8E7_9SPIR
MNSYSTKYNMETGLGLKKKAPPGVICIFGITGDLSKKKLVPALYALYVRGYLAENFKIIGFARRDWSDEFTRQYFKEALMGHPFFNDRDADEFLAALFYHRSSFDDPEGYAALRKKLSFGGDIIYYLATPPASYSTIIENLGESGLCNLEGHNIRIVIEKPFGSDLETARGLNSLLLRYFKEEQIYRIDHYLGKETVQNILALRFGNSIFEPIWNSKYIDHIQITVAEKIGVGSRINYYEKSGALRDMVQNHILQLLSLVTMEVPTSFESDAIRNEKVKILKNLVPIKQAEVSHKVIRAQYVGGYLDGGYVKGYREEEGVKIDSTTETYVALKAEIASWRWAGVPIYIRTGKRLSRKLSEVAVFFKPVPETSLWFGRPSPAPNALIMQIQPDEGISLLTNVKSPGYSMELIKHPLNFKYEHSFGDELPEAYERLLLDALTADPVLYTRADELEALWAYITGIREAWDIVSPPVYSYLPGSAGPIMARKLPAEEGRRWRRL